ncbi:hypothetical protein ACFXP3_35550, partial [Streptomyces sp. NPDC059096]|uniref:hypothetical protein n=1 Tax=Streptomyces sp. NPDC059096 TaxID=3346727 RepID=UPI00368FDF48
MPPNTQQPAGQPLLGLRSAIVLLLGVLTGAGAGVLTYLAQHSLPAAALAAGARAAPVGADRAERAEGGGGVRDD